MVVWLVCVDSRALVEYVTSVNIVLGGSGMKNN